MARIELTGSRDTFATCQAGKRLCFQRVTQAHMQVIHLISDDQIAGDIMMGGTPERPIVADLLVIGGVKQHFHCGDLCPIDNHPGCVVQFI